MRDDWDPGEVWISGAMNMDTNPVEKWTKCGLGIDNGDAFNDMDKYGAVSLAGRVLESKSCGAGTQASLEDSVVGLASLGDPILDTSE